MLYLSVGYHSYIRVFFICIWLFATLPSPAAAAESAPAATVRSLQQGMVDIDRRLGTSTGFAERYAAFAPLIESSHDLPYMARMTVKRYWTSLEADQREQFTRAFSDLSITTYASRFVDLGDVEFRLGDVRQMSRGHVEVQTELIAGNGESNSINYVLHPTDSGWLIINILAEGVSDLALQRSQYQQILKTRSFEELMRHIDTRRAEIEQEN
jgi:phospholipid transport system substrate-binding protein